MKRSLSWIRTSQLSVAEFREIQTRIAALRYGASSPNGFLCDRLTDRVIDGTLIETKRRESQIIGPSGEKQKLQWIDFRVIRFVFDRQLRLVETDASSRNLRPLFQQLGVASGWAASFEPITVEPSRMLDFLEREKVKFNVVRLYASDISVGENVIASVALKGRDINVDDLKSILKARPFTISRVILDLQLDSGQCTVDMSVSGKLVIEGDSVAECAVICRRGMVPGSGG